MPGEGAVPPELIENEPCFQTRISRPVVVPAQPLLYIRGIFILQGVPSWVWFAIFGSCNAVTDLDQTRMVSHPEKNGGRSKNHWTCPNKKLRASSAVETGLRRGYIVSLSLCSRNRWSRPVCYAAWKVFSVLNIVNDLRKANQIQYWVNSLQCAAQVLILLGVVVFRFTFLFWLVTIGSASLASSASFAATDCGIVLLADGICSFRSFWGCNAVAQSHTRVSHVHNFLLQDWNYLNLPLRGLLCGVCCGNC